MKRIVSLALVCLLMLAMPLVALAETMYVVTPNGGSVNLRLGPSSDDEILTPVGYGEAVDVIDMLAGSSWVNVNYNGNYGYIAMRYLSYYPPTPNPTFWPTFVPAPTNRPTSHPNPQPTAKPSGNTLEKTLSQMFSGFVAKGTDAIVVPSTPTTYVNLRWAPSKSAPVRAQYWAGNILYIVSQNNEWAEVVDPVTNMHGYMMTHFLSPTGFINGSDS